MLHVGEVQLNPEFTDATETETETEVDTIIFVPFLQFKEIELRKGKRTYKITLKENYLLAMFFVDIIFFVVAEENLPLKLMAIR